MYIVYEKCHVAVPQKGGIRQGGILPNHRLKKMFKSLNADTEILSPGCLAIITISSISGVITIISSIMINVIIVLAVSLPRASLWPGWGECRCAALLGQGGPALLSHRGSYAQAS